MPPGAGDGQLAFLMVARLIADKGVRFMSKGGPLIMALGL